MPNPSRFLLIQVGFWLLFLLAGFFLFRDMMVWGDPVLYYSPVHDLSPNWYSRIFPLSTLRATYQWYLSLNARLSQALFNALTREISLVFHISSPEFFPAWTMRATSTFMLFATPINFLAFLRLHRISTVQLATLGGFILLFWMTNPLHYFLALWMEMPLFQYFLPLYLLSVMAYLGKPRFGFWHLVIYFVIITSTEHYFVAAPILFCALAVLPAPPSEWMTILKKRVPFYAGASGIAIIFFLISPGQRWRNSVMKKEFLPKYDSLLNWYEKFGTMGYRTLFPEMMSATMFAVLSVFVLIAIVTLVWWSHRRNDKPRFFLSILSASFMLAYLVCPSTTLVSSYLPFYCPMTPNFFLVMALGLLLIGWCQPAKWMWALPVLFLALTVRKAPDMLFDYREARNNSLVRRWVGEEITRLNQPNVKTHFRILNFPQSSFDMAIESEWALRGYLEWRGLPLASAWVEPPLDPKPRENSIIIDYSQSPVKMPTRTIREMSFFTEKW